MPGTRDVVIDRNDIADVATDPRPEWPWAAITLDASAGDDEDPRHVVTNNVIHGTRTAIRAAAGCAIVNNLVHGIHPGDPAIVVDDPAGDGHPRLVWHNTVVAPPATAVVVRAGRADIRNNLGPDAPGNLPADPAGFRDAAAGDYHLRPGAAAVGAGDELPASPEVDTDRDGVPRRGARRDLGAYALVPAATD
jgi:hypothetical protein